MTDADRFRAELARLGYSQRALARELEVDDRIVRRWAAGKLPVPTIVWRALEALRPRPPPEV